MEPEGSFPCLQHSATYPYLTHVNPVHTHPSYVFSIHLNIKLVPVAARSKAYVCGRSPPGVVVGIPPGAWTFVCCECCVLSGRGLCDGLITRPEESNRLWCVVVCDLETS